MIRNRQVLAPAFMQVVARVKVFDGINILILSQFFVSSRTNLLGTKQYKRIEVRC